MAPGENQMILVFSGLNFMKPTRKEVVSIELFLYRFVRFGTMECNKIG